MNLQSTVYNVVPGVLLLTAEFFTVKNNLHNFVGFVLSTINFVAGTNEYGPKKG